ncbi:hypothetical protein SAMN06265364_1774 [Prevotella jejuni]|uniref:Uncharacterized protein n=1 Tax=Prevotella jejuni TaxID=1177574 RepID=A0AA94S1E5_9BACT|nr:hypothetical protein SAMN06265364_1774 [Prevotella jejuni]
MKDEVVRRTRSLRKPSGKNPGEDKRDMMNTSCLALLYLTK